MGSCAASCFGVDMVHNLTPCIWLVDDKSWHTPSQEMLAWTTGSEAPRTRSIHTAFVLHRCPTIGMSGDPATWIRALPEPLQSSVFLYFWHLLWIDTKQVCVGSHIGSRSRTSPSLDLCMLPESEPAINSCAHSHSCSSSNTHWCSCYTSSPWFLNLNLNRSQSRSHSCLGCHSARSVMHLEPGLVPAIHV